jgi:hypothetical protein
MPTKSGRLTTLPYCRGISYFYRAVLKAFLKIRWIEQAIDMIIRVTHLKMGIVENNNVD